MKKVLILSLITLFTSIGFADHKPGHKSAKHELPKNTVYAEALGASILYSVNYDRLLFNDWISLRAGFSYVPLPGLDLFTIPLAINFTGISYKSHIAELGVGTTIFIGSGSLDKINPFDNDNNKPTTVTGATPLLSFII